MCVGYRKGEGGEEELVFEVSAVATRETPRVVVPFNTHRDIYVDIDVEEEEEEGTGISKRSFPRDGIFSLPLFFPSILQFQISRGSRDSISLPQHISLSRHRAT